MDLCDSPPHFDTLLALSKSAIEIYLGCLEQSSLYLLFLSKVFSATFHGH